jgi:hypothetical protein
MKLSKQKQQHLAVVAILTAVICGGLWYSLVGYQNRTLAEIGSKTAEARKQDGDMRKLISQRDDLEADLQASTARLAGLESTFAEGDLYSWFILRLREFELPYHVDTPQINREIVGEVSLLPNFPYRQATYQVKGTAFYSDLGRFIADFENRFPSFRFMNLEISADSGASAEAEKLSFKVDISTLIRPAPKPSE